jgi:hypothetical protein
MGSSTLTIWFKFHTKNTGRLPLLLYSNQLLETVYIVLIWSHILTKCSSGIYVYTNFHLVPHFDEMFIRHVYTSFHLVIHFEKCSVGHMYTHWISFGPTFWEMFTTNVDTDFHLVPYFEECSQGVAVIVRTVLLSNQATKLALSQLHCAL